jgi:hypothetical protein
MADRSASTVASFSSLPGHASEGASNRVVELADAPEADVASVHSTVTTSAIVTNGSRAFATPVIQIAIGTRRRLHDRRYLDLDYARMSTGVPAGVSENRRHIAVFASRIQPWEAASPMVPG